VFPFRLPPPPISTPFPYTTLFRSYDHAVEPGKVVVSGSLQEDVLGPILGIDIGVGARHGGIRKGEVVPRVHGQLEHAVTVEIGRIDGVGAAAAPIDGIQLVGTRAQPKLLDDRRESSADVTIDG